MNFTRKSKSENMLSTQHLVYFLHAKGDDYCKIGESTSQRLVERIRSFEASKASNVKLIGYQFCKDKANAQVLEKSLLNQFDRIENQELVAINPELVKYILEHCDHKETTYLASLWSIPDYDDLNREELEKDLESHDCRIISAKETLRLASEKRDAAKRIWEKSVADMETAKEAYTTAAQERDRYLEQLAMVLRQKQWEIKKIAEVTGLDDSRVRNVVYKHAPPKLF